MAKESNWLQWHTRRVDEHKEWKAGQPPMMVKSLHGLGGDHWKAQCVADLTESLDQRYAAAQSIEMTEKRLMGTTALQFGKQINSMLLVCPSRQMYSCIKAGGLYFSVTLNINTLFFMFFRKKNELNIKHVIFINNFNQKDHDNRWLLTYYRLVELSSGEKNISTSWGVWSQMFSWSSCHLEELLKKIAMSFDIFCKNKWLRPLLQESDDILA